VLDYGEYLLSANRLPACFFERPKRLASRELMEYQPIYLQKVGLLVKTFDNVILPNFLEKSAWLLGGHV
jgi:hypothetical protein